MFPEHADKAIAEADGCSFQGRVIHIIRSKRAKESSNNLSEATDKKISKLSAFQAQRELERKKLAGKKDGTHYYIYIYIYIYIVKKLNKIEFISKISNFSSSLF